MGSIRIYYYFSVLWISHITFIIVTIQLTSSYIHKMHVLFISFFSNQRITQKSIIFHPRDFSYDFHCNLYKCTIYTSFSLLKKSITFLVFSKLDLNAYLSCYMLSIEFYWKNYCIFYHSLSKRTISNPAATLEESPSLTYNTCHH